MQELLRPLRELSNSDRRIFQPSWATLQKKKKTKHLRELIIEWSRSWNLDKDWCRDYAVIALWAWLTDAQLQWQASWREQRLSFREASVEAHIDDILKMNDEITSSTDEDSANLISLLNQGFSFTWKGLDFQTYRWNPIAKYRADWARDCEVSFKTYLSRREKAGSISPPGVLGKFRAARDAYIRKMAQVTKQAGLVRTPRRWADEHLTWAVRFQVYNWPLSKIEKTYLKPRKTIADGINRMLAFIDLDRRDNLRAGMPKGTSLSGRRRIVRK